MILGKDNLLVEVSHHVEADPTMFKAIVQACTHGVLQRNAELQNHVYDLEAALVQSLYPNRGNKRSVREYILAWLHKWDGKHCFKWDWYYSMPEKTTRKRAAKKDDNQVTE